MNDSGMTTQVQVEYGRLIYSNPLAEAADTDDFIIEGDGAVSFPMGRMRLESKRDPQEGQAANVVYWCPETLPDRIAVRWNFWPVRQPGLAILFFSAAGREGQDLFDTSLNRRIGIYDQYHSGDINVYHVSYFRKSYSSERRLQTCNLRKSFGFHLVAQGADPIPHIEHCEPPYRVELVKHGADIAFFVDGLQLFHYVDDGTTYGPVLGGGKIGFRQMSPLIAEYSDLQVFEVERMAASGRSR